MDDENGVVDFVDDVAVVVVAVLIVVRQVQVRQEM